MITFKDDQSSLTSHHYDIDILKFPAKKEFQLNSMFSLFKYEAVFQRAFAKGQFYLFVVLS